MAPRGFHLHHRIHRNPGCQATLTDLPNHLRCSQTPSCFSFTSGTNYPPFLILWVLPRPPCQDFSSPQSPREMIISHKYSGKWPLPASLIKKEFLPRPTILDLCSKGPTIFLFFFFFFFFGGGVGDFEKNILQVHLCVRKKIPAQDHSPKRISRTYSRLKKKNFWQDVPCADTLDFCISKLLKDFSIWT